MKTFDQLQFIKLLIDLYEFKFITYIFFGYMNNSICDLRCYYKEGLVPEWHSVKSLLLFIRSTLFSSS